jgi:hypothetical protein
MAPRLRVCAALSVLQFISVLPAPISAQDVQSPWKDSATGFGPDVGLSKTWNASFPLLEGIASLRINSSGATGSDGGSNTGADLSRRDDKDFWLRVMPLGASITQGVHSSDDNGYRKWIREQLRWEGWQVNSEAFIAPVNVNNKLLTCSGYSGWIGADGYYERQGNS